MTSLFSGYDYPIEALKRREQGIVGYALTISKKGLPKACQITQTSGSKRLDSATCSILMKRARFRPARDNYGRPIEDVYTAKLAGASRTELRQITSRLWTSLLLARLKRGSGVTVPNNRPAA